MAWARSCGRLAKSAAGKGLQFFRPALSLAKEDFASLPTVLLLLIASLFQACSEAPTVPPQDPTVDFCAEIHRNDSLSLTEELAPIADSMAAKTGVYVLEDGAGL